MIEIEHNDILFELPVEMQLVKSADGGEKRMVKGFASTESIDQDGEVILQHGIDFTPLLKSGFLNYDHQTVTGLQGIKMPTIVGYPTKAEIRDKGLWVEGELLKSEDPNCNSVQIKLANELWELGMALQKSGQRSLSYSVEGGVLERKGNKIVRSVVRGVALTHKPVNPDATVELFAKSHCCGKCNKNHPLYIPGHNCGDIQAETAPTSKEDKENVQKAMSTETAAPMMLENLDRGMSGVLYGPAKCEHFDSSGLFPRGITGAVEHLQKCNGLSKEQSIDFLRKTIHNAPYRPDLSALVKQAGLITTR